MPSRLRAPRIAASLWIAGLTVVFLGAIASAIPPAPIELPDSGAQRGMLVGHARVIDRLAEQLANSGYNYVAVDLSTASPDPDALWRENVDLLTQRRFPVWGWLDVRKGMDRAPRFAQSLVLQGFYLYGPDAVDKAAWLRRQQPGLRVLPVVRFGEPLPESGEYAVAMEIADLLVHGERFENPVLLAALLDAEQIAEARNAVDGNLLVTLASVVR